MMKTAFLAILVISLQSPAFSQSPVSSRQSVAIAHVTVIDTGKGVALSDMTVITNGDRIVSVDQKPAPPNAQIVDGRGKFLIPGLWDMHSHLTDSRVSA